MEGEDTRSVRFERVFRDHRAAVRAYALRRTDPARAQDAVSETFLVAWRRFDALPDEPLPWLFGTTRRVLANQRRAERHQRLRALLRSGNVRDSGQVTFAGRKAWRFAIERPVGEGFVEFPSRSSKTPAYTRLTVLIVDGRFHLPLFLRKTGLVPTEPERRGGRVTFPRRTTSERCARFDRLAEVEGNPGLQPSPRFKRIP